MLIIYYLDILDQKINFNEECLLGDDVINMRKPLHLRECIFCLF